MFQSNPAESITGTTTDVPFSSNETTEPVITDQIGFNNSLQSDFDQINVMHERLKHGAPGMDPTVVYDSTLSKISRYPEFYEKLCEDHPETPASIVAMKEKVDVIAAAREAQVGRMIGSGALNIGKHSEKGLVFREMHSKATEILTILAKCARGTEELSLEETKNAVLLLEDFRQDSQVIIDALTGHWEKLITRDAELDKMRRGTKEPIGN